MVDPLVEVVTLLQPTARHVKVTTAGGPWRVSRKGDGHTFYCAVLEGSVRFVIDGGAPIVLERGDFVLLPAAVDFVASSPVPPRGRADSPLVFSPGGDVHHGPRDVPVDVRLAIGHGAFASPDAALLVSLLPKVILVRGDPRRRGEPRLATLLSLVTDEARASRPGRELVLSRLLEVVLLEALRASETSAAPGLLRGLADERVAVALRRLHAAPEAGWTLAGLAKEAGLSRSAFFERFTRAVGVPPMQYVLGWRVALAKRELERGASVAEVATRVGYGSASAFSVAFTRYVGEPPTHYARGRAKARA